MENENKKIIYADLEKICNENHARRKAERESAAFVQNAKKEKRRKILTFSASFLAAAAGAACAIGLFMYINTHASTASTLETRPGVTTVNKNQIMTEDGRVWNYPNHYPEKVKVKVYFDNKGTESKYDDSIVKVELK